MISASTSFTTRSLRFLASFDFFQFPRSRTATLGEGRRIMEHREEMPLWAGFVRNQQVKTPDGDAARMVLLCYFWWYIVCGQM
jgi:hypothetical protein